MGRPAENLAGRRFGDLVAIEDTGERDHGSAVWRCLCSCGRVTSASARDLMRGSVKSCGKCSQSVREGRRFGALTAVQETRPGVWLCRCECGREKVVEARDLLRGAVTSCGCGIARMRRAKASAGAVEGTRLSSLTQRTRETSASGVKGVTRGNTEGTWAARIKFQGHDYYLGQYKSCEAAVEARKHAEEMLFEPTLRRYGRSGGEAVSGHGERG